MPASLSTTPPSSAPENVLRPVIRLLYVNLAFSVALAALTFVFDKAILDYQVGALAGGDAGARDALEGLLWLRPISVLVIGFVYLRLAKRLHLRRRRTYVRVLLIAVLGCAGQVYLVVSAQFPLWMRIGQLAQAAVLLALLFAVTRPAVRSLFAKNASR
ncbi:hypothetical protein [Streptoalloteichus hindustanus]|uniref:Uncharacterized protein n=1 Tax=Streptoalloteichus hindustanus TaxID=2017 RepID=A0A1M5FQI1_STRHI|nr:hypothetical protein [Streptoalloteichus hindustanus]SHF93810.1 hypothetical protein SAMN05444320_105548 [Streptoalloteichus hindustanus]